MRRDQRPERDDERPTRFPATVRAETRHGATARDAVQRVAPQFDIVVPTTARPTLGALLERLAGVGARRIIAVDDRRGGAWLRVPGGVEVLRSGGRGPAAARNAGWRTASAPWVVFVDDDVAVGPDWGERLAADLAAAPRRVGGCQGRVRVPLPAGRPPTDWERDVAGLERARWITADLAVRRAALLGVGGFDERFPRAYREDADLALRLVDAGWALALGERTVAHPVGVAGPWVSVRRQAGNADDALMNALHGRGWRERAGAPRGRLRAHAATTAAGAAALAAVLARRRRPAAALAAAWLAATGDFTWRRIAPGPRTPAEVLTMAATSAVLPAAATVHHLRGRLRAPRLLRDTTRAPSPVTPPAAVLLDRDGTLIADVPYNGDPARVEPVPGARAAVERLRAAGVRLAVVTNQSGISRGLLTPEQVAAVNARVEHLLGPLGPWLVCPHGPADGCACRKPRPGLVLDAAARLGIDPDRCAVVGDVGADVQAALTAGARAVLVPNDVTREDEVRAAPEIAGSLGEAVGLLLGTP
jgi:histidinol-phosphate phosphatase family protein